MNTSSLMDRLSYIYLLIFMCFTLVCTYGSAQDLFPSCEVGLMVRRGTAWKTGPGQLLTVRCPVKHCGESLNVTWCKLLDTNKCEQINYTENVEIIQKHVKDGITSFLTFKRISIHDDGLYRCYLKGYKYGVVSHIINISVSDLNQGVKNSDNNADELASTADEEDVSWLPYFYICISIALLVITLTVLTLLSFYGWKGKLTRNHTKGQEMSTHVIPDLPKRSAPSTHVLQTHFSILNDICTPNTAEKPLSQPPLMTTENQPAVANTADKSQVLDRAVYAVINHRQPGIPAREQHTVTKQNKNTEYAAINVS
ncbi:B- and T-lymphocyte attenuator [Siniperca chuatsi]|uniref:B- and T-lymphocyte attenuator n=1 Tax=Siniperca chuatsi TaxID=119488 RepID=UPI001CE0EB2F|nr:B- and T-lymphocyte attenuator [Siniperca chuatsi]